MLGVAVGEDTGAGTADNGLVVSSRVFRKLPPLIFLKKQTNLNRSFAPPPSSSPNLANWEALTMMPQQQHEQQRDSAPDFASDNDVLCKLLAWNFSDQLVSVIVHRIGETLVLLGGVGPTFCPDSPPSAADARLVGGFDVMHPPTITSKRLGEEQDSTPTATTSTSLEEERKLKLSASQQIKRQRTAAARDCKKKDGMDEGALSDALHCLSGGNAPAMNVCHLHSFSFHIMLKSCLRVYGHDASSSSLILRNEADRFATPRDFVVRVFLDNLLAGIARVNVCYHAQGLVKGYETYKTWEIPTKMKYKGSEGIDVREIERNAQALFHLLKSECKEDFSIHWLFKGQGERMARLWRLDPLHDASLDQVFRDHVLFQHAMLCLGACSSSSTLHHFANNNYQRERMLVEKSLELLDACAESLEAPAAARRPLRAALRERMADLLFFSGKPVRECFVHLAKALVLLCEEEAESQNGNSAFAKQRVLERGLAWALNAQQAEEEEEHRDGSFLCEVCAWAESATKLDGEEELEENVLRLLATCRKRMGEQNMMRAQRCAQALDFAQAKQHSQLAIECFETALLHCASRDGFFLLGNALNEFGKLLLREGKLGDARLVFSRGVGAFREAGDGNNLAILRCNVAHTFRLGRTRETLVLALNELHSALAENLASQHWTACLRSEIFKTMLLLAKLLLPSREEEAWQVLNKALLEYASTREESATAHFHMASLRLPAQTQLAAKLARRHFEQVLALVPNGHELNAHARIELAELALVDSAAPPNHDQILKSLLGNFNSDKDDDDVGNKGSELKTKLVAVLCKLLRKSAHKAAYRCVLNEMLHPNPIESSSALVRRVRAQM